MTARFDPSASVAFDLSRGQIALQGSGERVLVPADALVALCAGAGTDVARDFARRLGTEAGRRALERLGTAGEASVEAVVEHLGGDLALMGLGALSVEVWGEALVLLVDGSPLGAAGDGVLADVLEGALQRAFGRDAGVTRLSRDDARARFLVTSRPGAERVKGWLGAGTPWGEVLTRLSSGYRGDA